MVLDLNVADLRSILDTQYGPLLPTKRNLLAPPGVANIGEIHIFTQFELIIIINYVM